MKRTNNNKKNNEGYLDPTVYAAMKSMENKEKEKLRAVLNAIFNTCDKAGFSVQGRIVLKDNKTGKVWR